ncbi:acyl-CoA thioesterase [Sphingomonas sp. GlSt437]|uniref:acyl-CoA thioesterase n=1 Tax=Sphingomonas sp. GlSt437 TaxID=3389970 RepID=UPI003A84B4C1
MSFVSRHRVRFAHCDPAGIAYYPRLLELVDAAIEDWTHYGTGVSRAVMHEQHRLGLPTATLATDFARPVQLADELEINVAVTGIGTTSVNLAVDAQCAGERRFSATLVQVLINLGNGQPHPWPEAWRQQLLSVQ